MSADLAGNTKMLVQMATLCFKAGDFVELDTVVVAMSKKRSILKQAVANMVQKCLEWIPTVADASLRMKLIETVRSVTEGKIYVEVERARVTRILGDIHEKAGRIKEAAMVIQELQVETFGSMDKREKVDFILEQIRLSIAVGEFQKARIISRKVTGKTFEIVAFEDLKLRYLELMVQLAVHDGIYLECCRHYMAIFETKMVQENKEKYLFALKMAVIFVVLASFSNDQSDLMNILYREKKLEHIPLYREFLHFFLTKELLRWPVVEKVFGDELRSIVHLFGNEDQASKLRWKHLNERVIEHNVRIIGKFYGGITMKRFAELLDLSLEDAEHTLASLVANGMIWAKIDRTTGIITFQAPKSADETLNSWNSCVDSLLSLMVKTNHQIAKEEMVHSAIPKN
jgi:26S proteasome regulatory subunit N5